jgi:integrase
VELADDRLLELGGAPLPFGLTPHSLRRTFASVLYALGTAPTVVMAEMGHTSPALALRIYAQAMSRDEGQIDPLRELVEGADWAPAGHPDTESPLGKPSQDTAS